MSVNDAKKWLVGLCAAVPLWACGAEETTSVQLTLMTYNIHIGIPMGEDFGKRPVVRDDLQRISDVITSVSPDIVAMQEVDCEFGYTLPKERQRSSLINEPRLLAHLTGMSYIFGSSQDDVKYPSDNGLYVEWGQPDQWTNNREVHGEVGNAVLVKQPFRVPPENVQLPRLPEKERRTCLRVELNRELANFEQTLVVYATHLQHDSGSSRMDQMRTILARIANEPKESVVFLLGDLNNVAEDNAEQKGNGEDVVELAEHQGFVDLVKAYAEAMGVEPEATFPADKPDRRIDYVLCNRKVWVREARVVRSLASDHLPVVVKVDLGSVEGRKW